MNKKILLGITGGIACYKSAELVRELVTTGFDVRVLMTKNAEQFIKPLLFEALSGKKVVRTDFSGSESAMTHINIAREADLLVVAPATANIIGKYAGGIADDTLSTTLLAFDGQVLIAPAMNSVMWRADAVCANVEILENRGINFVGPESGSLACGETGEGRMSEVCDITERIKYLLAERSSLEGKRIIVTAGGTREPVDAVRFIGNRSSGKMGRAIAEELLARGAQVDFIGAAMEIDPPSGVNLVRVETAEEMYGALLDLFPKSDGLIMSAAVGDYKAKFPSEGKVKKRDEWQISLEKNRDVVGCIAKNRGDKVVVGFAAETENHIEHGRSKLAKKGIDIIVVNDVSRTDIGFGSDQNEATLLFADGESVVVPKSGKKKIAKVIIDSVENMLKNKIQRLRPA